MPATTAYAPPPTDVTSSKTYPNVAVALPATQSLPVQEPGVRLARALPYQLHADRVSNGSGAFDLSFRNSGAAGAWFHVRTANDSVAGGSTGPWGYTVEAGKSLSDTWSAPAGGRYDVAVHGPNGFFRHFAGGTQVDATNLVAQASYDVASGGISLRITNVGKAAVDVTVTDQYTKASSHQVLAPGASFRTDWSLKTSDSWYDLMVSASTDASFVCHYAGHVETGRASASDPLL
jgi:phospholipase C